METELRYIERLDGSHKVHRVLQYRPTIHSPWRDVPVITLAQQTDEARQHAEDSVVYDYG